VSQEPTNRSFDELAKGLATGTLSRGKALRLMGAALVGGTLGSLGMGEAAGDPPGCKRNGKKCKRNTQCCSENCVNGRCACPVGTTPCDTQCCPEGRECVGGQCQGGCPSGRTLTEGDCNCADFCDAPDPSLFACQNNPDCLCTKTTENTGFCAKITGPCEPPCSSSSDCPSGWKCQVDSCCATPVCGPPCTCAQNGSICSSDSECCSGMCESETCA
jgi:hypothetical protein